MPRNPQLADFTVPELADMALVTEDALQSEAFEIGVTEQLVEDRKLFLDELVARGALDGYKLIPAA